MENNKVFVVEYCEGEVGNLVWINHSFHKTKESADNTRKDLLKKVYDLQSEYHIEYKYAFTESLKNKSNDAIKVAQTKSNIKIANEVVNEYKLQG